MAIDRTRLETPRKSDYIINYTVSSGITSLQISNVNIFFTVKENYDDIDSNAKIAISNATSAILVTGLTTFVVTLSETDTDLPPKEYIYEVLIDVDGTEYKPSIGKFVIAESVRIGSTVALSTSDLYDTITNAQLYFDTLLDAEAWDESSDVNRNKALYMATRAVDRLNFKGKKAVSGQVLQFPRGSDTAIPQDIKFATFEEAISLLDGADILLELEGEKIKSARFGPMNTVYDRSVPSEHLSAGITSIKAWRYLKPYLRDSRSINVSKI